MSVLIICFSCVSAFADTTVDDTKNINNKEFFNNLFSKSNADYNKLLSLSSLPLDDYFTFLVNQSSYGNYINRLFFIPTAGFNFVRKDVTESEYNQYVSSGTRLAKDNEIVLLCISFNSGGKAVKVVFNNTVYSYTMSHDRTEFLEIDGFQINGLFNFIGSYSNKPCDGLASHFFYNNSKVNNLIKDFLPHTSFISSLAYTKNDYESTDYVSSLFVYAVQLIPGYVGAVYDSSLDHILESNGKICDDSIIDKYKYQIYYSLNNDLRMVFLNNAYQPQYKKDKFQGTNSDDAYKYKFHYNKTSDCIVYYPTFKMYLSYDDWYKFQPEDNSFKWWWEEDTKDFTLISDWKYSNGTYTGTRVATNWEKLNQLGESADFTAISSFITDKDKLLDNGWKDGRPSDTNYPYCIEVDYNGKAGLFIYSNSKPKVSKVDIISDTHKQFDIYMIGMYGYVYNAINNCYINYDFTIKDGQKNFVQQYLFKYFSYELHCLDKDLNLTLYENYKGSDTDYKGTRVFFNWDITQDLKLSADDLKKIQNNCKEDIGGFIDSNGNQHGGNLNNYSDEDKNKFNESGSNSDSTTDNNFDFSFDGIMNYCDSFFSFMQSAFSVFPASLWVLISLSIAMLVFLRVLGR